MPALAHALPIPGTDHTAITGIVRDHQVAAALAALDALATEGERDWTPMTRREATTRYPEGDAWKAPLWRGGGLDVDRFLWVVGQAKPRTLAGFRAIAEEGRLTGEQIAARTGYDDGRAWRAALPHIRAYCSRVDRRPIWSADEKDASGRSVFTMRPEVRELALAHIPATAG